ncbi:class F sortase [Patescibacteria group bacterium]|nr:class F sortase [Patescibacteria group bacterium]
MKKLSAALIIIVFAFIGVGTGLGFLHWTGSIKHDLSPQPQVALGVQKQVQVTEAPKEQILPPKTITIPKIGVDAVVEQVGEDSSGKMDVPKKSADVGWYSLGYKPGEKGSAVLDGHLDTVTGAPAVFYDIDKLEIGDQVIVTDEAGKTLIFEVVSVQSYPFDQVPLQEVFGSSDKPKLNLITCTGVWNTGSRNYSNRLVVYTELKS